MARNSHPSNQKHANNKHDRFHGRVGSEHNMCEADGCNQSGEFRAPNNSQQRPHDGPPPAHWFCLDHIRQYNAAYDFFAGMNEDEIYEAQHPATGWDTSNRWPNGSNPPPRWSDFTDPLDAIGDLMDDRVHAMAIKANAPQ